MEKNIFWLENDQLKEIASSFQEKVEEGLKHENAEIQCIPTFISPKTSDINGKALVLDLGGTNYRVATVDLGQGSPTIHPNNGWKKDMSIMKSPGYTREELFKELADMIVGIKRDEEMPIGYCFSYPAESVLSGDAKLLRWTKGVDIKEMVGQLVGKPLLDYSYDAYIGLIVGTGTNMATFIPADKIKKLDPSYNIQGLVPVNLESGNFHPPFLTTVDDTVDAISGSLGKQRFEKAVSGMYLGDILKAAFPLDEFENKFDAKKLTAIMNYPDIHKDVYVDVAHWIYNRSAQLVAASLLGLIQLLRSYNKDIQKICLVAEGSLFWSENRKDKNYNILVLEKLQELLNESALADIEIHINNMNNANLIGTGIAALS